MNSKSNKNAVFLSICLTTMILFSPPALAQHDGVGNGGWAYFCGGRGQIVDVYEASQNHIQMSLGGTSVPIDAMMKTYFDRWLRLNPDAAKTEWSVAEKWLAEIKSLGQDPAARTAEVRMTPYSLPLSLDSDEISTPPGCERVQIISQTVPEVTGDRRLTIYKPGWDKLDNEQKVFLLAHETHLYREITISDSVSSSRPARYLNSLLGSSDLSQSLTPCEFIKQNVAVGMAKRSFRYGGVIFDGLENVHLHCAPNGGVSNIDLFGRGNSRASIDWTNLATPSGRNLGRLRVSLSSVEFNPSTQVWDNAQVTELMDDSGLRSRYLAVSPYLSQPCSSKLMLAGAQYYFNGNGGRDITRIKQIEDGRIILSPVHAIIETVSRRNGTEYHYVGDLDLIITNNHRLEINGLNDLNCR